MNPLLIDRNEKSFPKIINIFSPDLLLAGQHQRVCQKVGGRVRFDHQCRGAPYLKISHIEKKR